MSVDRWLSNRIMLVDAVGHSLEAANDSRNHCKLRITCYSDLPVSMEHMISSMMARLKSMLSQMRKARSAMQAQGLSKLFQASLSDFNQQQTSLLLQKSC